MRSFFTSILTSWLWLAFLLGLSIPIEAQIHILGGEKVRGNGVIDSMAWQVPAFDKLKIRGSVDVVFSPDIQDQVIMITDENILPHLLCKHQSDGTLIVGTPIVDQVIPTDWKPVKVILPESELTYLSQSGSGSSEGIVKAKKNVLTLRLRGSGDMDLSVDANVLDTKVSGSGKMKLKVAAKRVDASISGSGDIVFRGTYQNGNFKISGSGNIYREELVEKSL